MTSSPFIDDLVDIARAAAAVANYCDHAEHNEVVDAGWVLDAGRTLRTVALRIATREGIDLWRSYSRRLNEIEQRGVPGMSELFDGPAAAAQATTWYQLQRVQAQHDRCYHLDVVGLHKAEQLRHYALHLAKLSGAIAEVLADDSHRNGFMRRRLPDLLLFGLKLPTVMGRALPDTALPEVEIRVSDSTLVTQG